MARKYKLLDDERKEDRKSRRFIVLLLVLVTVTTVGVVGMYLHLHLSEHLEEINADELISEMFKVGVYEQRLVHAYNATTREEALVAINANLANIEQRAAMAMQEGVKVMVFAEYGLTGNMGENYQSRSSVYPYMEEIPDVSKTDPYCVDCAKVIPGREGQTTTGCIALKYKMYVLVNLIESVPCDSSTDKRCPSDGHYLYNTNLVFNPNGCLIAKYHKYHLYAEEFIRIDHPAKPEFSFFDTEYGRFGMIICCDAMFKEPTIPLVERYDIDHMIFPTYWDNMHDYAYMGALEWQLGVASLLDVNFIGANIHVFEENYGSSILSGKAIVNYTSNYTTISGRLIVGDLPVKKPQKIPPISREANLEVALARNQTAQVYGDTFNIVILDGLAGNIQVCQESFCCSLEYRRNDTDDFYILGAYKGLHTLEEEISLEVCLVTKCTNSNVSSCSNREIVSFTAFPLLKLSATFGVKYVYPVMSPSKFEYKHLNWTFERDETDLYKSLTSSSEWPLITAALVGRDFDHDNSTHYGVH